MKRKKKRKGRSVQDLLGVITFTKYGLETAWGELLFFQVAPANISVLSGANIEIKINRLKMLLSVVPDLEFICTDSCERFDDNKAYLQARTGEETNPRVKILLHQDMDMLTDLQAEMSTARQFILVKRYYGLKSSVVFHEANEIQKKIAEAGFEVRRMRKPEIKRFLAICFGASMDGDQMPDVDGGQYGKEVQRYETLRQTKAEQAGGGNRPDKGFL